LRQATPTATRNVRCWPDSSSDMPEMLLSGPAFTRTVSGRFARAFGGRLAWSQRRPERAAGRAFPDNAAAEPPASLAGCAVIPS